MAVPLLIGMAVASAAAGVMGAMSQASAAARQNASIEKLIELQGKAYDVQKRARASQYRDLAFNQMQVFETHRMNTRQQMLESRIQDNVNKLANFAKVSEIQKAKFQSEQEFILNQQREANQQLRDVNRQTGQQAREVSQAIKQVDMKPIQEARAQATGSTATSFARQNRLDVEEDTIASQKIQTINKVMEDIKDTQEIANTTVRSNQQLFNLQNEMNQVALDNQMLQEQMALGLQNDYGKLNRELIKSQSEAFKLASRANFLAERVKLNTQRETDKLQYKSTINQLKAGMVSADITPAIVGGLANLAGGIAGSGIFNRVPTPSVSSVGSLPNAAMSGFGSSVFNTATRVNPAMAANTVFPQQSSMITTMPPITRMPPITQTPNTFGLNSNSLQLIMGR